MKYFFELGENPQHLLLLHGTGGDEQSLVQIANFLAGNCTILSFRGEVEEDGMNRFFKRNGLNQFDLPSLEMETDALYAEIVEISKKRQIAVSDWTLVGYSNGANIGAHLLLERDTPLNKGLFFHPMSLGVDTKDFSLEDNKVWLSFGDNDPIVSDESFQTLQEQFTSRQAEVEIFRSNQSHNITMEELSSAKRWLKQQKDNG
ncbi:alpha/beta hydrolase [Enterococcus timonensis]|uniref:alpha/beta hydrolase n=1 Tax=Enterococcus timonensis TaxID=1852364 RepID=UPI0008DB22B5|nr:dienelactone hydrolase family protein [Enterococcus timonensis]